jgi:hypothetical protein
VLLGRLTTIPSRDRWDGISSMPLACGPGENHPAGADPDLDKIRAAESNPALWPLRPWTRRASWAASCANGKTYFFRARTNRDGKTTGWSPLRKVVT